MGLNIFFVLIDHFKKIWKVSLKDKTTKNIKLNASKKCITTHNITATLQIYNGTEFKNSIMIGSILLEGNIKYMLKGFCIKYESEEIKMQKRLAQGSTLFPILFSIFLNDLLNELEANDIYTLSYPDHIIC